MIQEFLFAQRSPEKDKKLTQNYFTQHVGVPFFNRISQSSDKTTIRDINHCTKIDLNDTKNSVFSNSFKVYQM